MSTHDDAAAPILVDHEMVDTEGNKIGTIKDVVYDDQSLDRTPRWAIVDRGLFHSAHVVPLQGCYRDAQGRLVTPYDRALVEASPKAPKDHVITPDVERAVRTHYGVTASSDER